MRTPTLLLGACAALSLTASGCTIDPDVDTPGATPTDTGAADTDPQDAGADTEPEDAGVDTDPQDVGTDIDPQDAGADALPQDTDTQDVSADTDTDATADAGSTIPGYDGDWHDDAERTHRIGAGLWTITDAGATERFAVLSSDEGVVIAENDVANPSNGGLYSRFDLVETTAFGTLLCQTVSDAATAEAAAAAAAPDAENLALGCGGSAWFTLIGGPAPIELDGVWFEGDVFWSFTLATLTVDGGGQFREYSIRTVDNVAGEAVVRASDISELDPGTWVRFEWRRDGDNVWICGVGLGSLDRAAAEAAIEPDDTDPATGGCNGAAWTQLTP